MNKTFVFFSMPGHGHVNPTLALVKELTSRGNKIIYYSLDEFKTKIEAAGATYRSYPREMYADPIVSKDIAAFAFHIISITENFMPNLVREISADHPDYIVYDTLALWGTAIASELNIPSIVYFTHIAFTNSIERKYFPVYIKTMASALNSKLFKAIRIYIKLSAKYHFKQKNVNEFLFNHGDLNIIFTSSYFHPCSANFDTTYKFVGPSIIEPTEKHDYIQKIDTKKKIIYISVGTIFNNNKDFFTLCFETFSNTDYQIILSIGHRFTLSDFPPIPSNFIVKNHIPQLEVLKKTDVFISHAGMNSINESLYYGIPMILIPQIHEQTVNALRLKELGAGIYINPTKLTKQALLDAVEEILKNKSYARSAATIQKTLHEAGGYKKAAEEIVDFVTADVN